MEITFRKITNADILNAQKRLQYKIEDRALRKAYQKIKESKKSINKFSGLFNDNDVALITDEAFFEELSGYSMPPPVPTEMAGFSSFMKKLRKGINKRTSNLLRGVHKVVKKIAPAVLAAVVSMIASPAAGQAIAMVLSNTASKYSKRHVMKSEYNKMLQKAKGNATALPKSMFEKLPLGVNNEQATDIVNGKMPVDMTGEQVFHAVQQALLISKEKISPVDAYVLHFHRYGQNAPPIFYKGDPDPKLVKQLDDLQNKLGKLEIGTRMVAAMQNNPQTETKIKETKKEIERLEKFIKESTTKYFSGAVYEGAGTVPVPATEKKDAVEATLSQEATNDAVIKIKQQLEKQGIAIKSPEAIESLTLQVKQLQQNLATAVATGKPINNVPTTIVGNSAMPVQLPPIKPVAEITKTKEGDTQVKIEKPKKSGVGALLLPAAGILLALKGG